MTGFLQEVSGVVRERIVQQKTLKSEKTLRAEIEKLKMPFVFFSALKNANPIGLIAELKQASPSAGLIRKELDIAGRIEGYEKGGATALSILTEEKYFNGSASFLQDAAKRTQLPLLRKDFMIDLYQIYESRFLGAHAILLIVAMLSDMQLQEFLHCAQEYGMDALIEIHDESELERASRLKPSLIGVNNRNLQTLQVDLGVGERLLPKVIQLGALPIVESGIRTQQDVNRFYQKGARALLVGETLMREPNAEKAVSDLLKGVQK